MKTVNEVKTWDDYKTFVKVSNPMIKQDMEKAEQLASIVSAVIDITGFISK